MRCLGDVWGALGPRHFVSLCQAARSTHRSCPSPQNTHRPAKGDSRAPLPGHGRSCVSRASPWAEAATATFLPSPSTACSMRPEPTSKKSGRSPNLGANRDSYVASSGICALYRLRGKNNSGGPSGVGCLWVGVSVEVQHIYKVQHLETRGMFFLTDLTAEGLTVEGEPVRD